MLDWNAASGAANQWRWFDNTSLCCWVRQDERDHGVRAGMSTSERERLRQLERESLELKRANEILRKASAFFAQAELDRPLK